MTTRTTAVLVISLAICCSHVLAQVVDNPGFKALPRPINYATPLAPAEGAKAVIVYGKDAPWTQAAATAVRKAIEDWSGVKLELADDRTVTSEETWLLNDAYRKTPLIVLGNAQDNRVMHALGTRYLLRSNRTWPAGDRFVIRTVFEPFVADVNYVVLEASNQAGMDAAAAKFAELFKTFDEKAKTASTIPPRVHLVGSVKDKWDHAGFDWKAPAEWADASNKSITELIGAFKGKPSLAGTAAWNDHVTFDIWWWMQGGFQEASTIIMDDGDLRAHAAMCLLGCRAQGQRTHGNFDHYGAAASFMGIRSAIQACVLSPEELNEFESCVVLSTALPLDYVYNQIGDPNGGGNRHYSACLFSTAVAVDYVLNHCRMDDKTRKEMQRRHDNVRKSTAPCVRTFMDGDDSDCLGEDVLMQANTMLHEGFMEYVRNGNLRRSANLYLFSVDNMPGHWGASGLYIGLYGFSSNPGAMLASFWGGGLVEEAAYYYDDPQIRWLSKNWTDIPGSRGGGYYYWPQDRVGKMTKPVVPTTYDGVNALPYDERLCNIVSDPAVRREEPYRLPPESLAKGVFRVAFRDQFDNKAAFLSLTGSSNPRMVKASQNNMIARFTDLAEVWLYTNVNDSSGWVRNVVSISNGKSFVPRTACSLDAMANLGEVSATATREPGVAGADWTRNIVHWRGHYFVVIDRMEALADDPARQGDAVASEFAYVCRWRCPQLASLKDGVWTAVAPSGAKMHIQNAEPVFQTSENWEIDGAAAPYVLQQYKHAKLAKGQAQTYQNLLYVSGQERPDEFEARQVNPQAMLVKGRTEAGDHLALIGVGGKIPLEGFETDAAIYDVVGNTLHLAGVTTLKAKVGTEMQEVFSSQKPLNVLVDCDTGKGEIEVRGDAPVQAKTGETSTDRKPGREPVTLAQAGALPKPAGLVEAMWNRSKPVAANTTGETAGQADVFEAKPASASLQRPLKRLTNADIASTPKPNYQRNSHRRWHGTDDLEITFTLPEPTMVGCLRVVGVNKEPPTIVGRGQLPAEWLGTTGPINEPGDLKFSLVFSDDGFKSDLRKIDDPKVTTEFTSDPPCDHTSMQHFLTWRVEVGQKARQVKLMPRTTVKERAKLDLKDIEVYAAGAVDELAAKVSVADLDGDGSNELVVGTSQRQLAAYDATGRQLWIKNYPGDILKMDTADMNGDGKAEAVAYLTTETLHQVKADGSEGPTGNVLQGERDNNNGCWGVAGAFAMAIWAPDGEKKKEALLFTEWSYGVAADGTVKPRGRVGLPLGAGRLVNLYPNEPEVLVEVGGRAVDLWSARRDKNGLYTHLGVKSQVAGPDGGALAWVQQVDLPDSKGFLAAAHNGINFYPLATLQPNNHEKGWEYNSGGVPAVAALLADLKGDGVPQVFMARLDGFVNVLKVADGSLLGLLNTGEPVVGLAMLKGKDGKPCLAVGTKFGVHLFGGDCREIGSHKLPTPAAGFAGPGGKDKNSVYVVDVAGNVTVLTIK